MDVCMAAKKKKKKEANDEVGNPASFLHPAFPPTSDSLAFWCFVFARQCCQIFRSDEKRSEREAFPFSPPLSIFLSFFPLSWKVSARCKVSRFYWSQSFTGSVRFVEFSKKLHSLLNHRHGFMQTWNSFYTFGTRAASERDVKLRKYTSNFSIPTPFIISAIHSSEPVISELRGFELWKYLIVCWCHDRLHFWKPCYWRFNHIVFFFLFFLFNILIRN